MSLTPSRPNYLTDQLLGLREANPGLHDMRHRFILKAAEDYQKLLVKEIAKPGARDIYPQVEPTVTFLQDLITFKYDGFEVSFQPRYPFVIVTPKHGEPYPLCWRSNGLALTEAVTDEIHWGLFRYLGHDIAVPPPGIDLGT